MPARHATRPLAAHAQLRAAAHLHAVHPTCSPVVASRGSLPERWPWAAAAGAARQPPRTRAQAPARRGRGQSAPAGHIMYAIKIGAAPVSSTPVAACRHQAKCLCQSAFTHPPSHSPDTHTHLQQHAPHSTHPPRSPTQAHSPKLTNLQERVPHPIHPPSPFTYTHTCSSVSLSQA